MRLNNQSPNIRLPRIFLIELSVLILWSAILIFILFRLNGEFFGIDDAHIFFTYAQHLADGGGLIYADTIPVVEGYTSTLWMLIVSAIFFFGWGELGVLIIATTIFITKQYLVFRLIDSCIQVHQKFLAKCIYLALVASSCAYLSWTTVTLMDTGLWSLVIVAMAYSIVLVPNSIGRIIISSIPFAIAPLVRPEGFFLGPTILLLYWALQRPEGVQRKFLFSALIMTFCTMITITTFRFWYFGFPFPNTFYAKVANSWTYNIKEGLAYFYQYVSGSPILSLSILCSAILGFRFFLMPFFNPRGESPSAPKHSSLGIVSSLIICVLILPILLGGDHFHWFRFYQPIFPLLCFLLAWASADFSYWIIGAHTRPKTAFTWLTFFGLFTLFISWLYFFSGNDSWYLVRKHGSPIIHEFRIAQEGKDKGLLLNELFIKYGQTKPAIGVYIAGGIARTYKGPIYDLMGLNNTQIAHFPGDRKGIKNHAAFESAIFFKLPIDLLLATPDSGFESAIFKGLFTQPDFGHAWEFGVVRSKTNPSLEFAGLYKKTFVHSLIGNEEIEFLPKKYFDSANNKWVPL